MRFLGWLCSFWLLVGLWAGLCAGTARAADGAQSPVLELQALTQRAALTGHMGLHVDRAGTLTYEQALLADYTPLEKDLNIGYTADVHWYRFTLRGGEGAPAEWVVALGAPYLDDVQVWLAAPQVPTLHFQLGDHVALTQRPIPSRWLAFPALLPEAGEVVVHVRVQSISSLGLAGEVWQPAAFVADGLRTNIYLGAYIGTLGLVILIAMVFSAWLRDFGMLSFGVYVCTVLLHYVGTQGYTAILLPVHAPWLSDAVVGVGVVGGVATAILMWAWQLELRNHYPRTNRLLCGMAVAMLALLPLVTSPYYRVIAPVVSVVALCIMGVLLLSLPFLWWQQKRAELLFYFAAVVANFCGASVQIGMVLGWVERNELSANALWMATLGQILLMFMGLATQVQHMHRQRLRAEQAVVALNHRAQDHRRFVAFLSHEFRNPLAAIDRAAHMLQLKTAPPISAPVDPSERLRTVRSNVAKLSGLVSNFLTTEALEQGGRQARPEQCALQQVFVNVLTELHEPPDGRVHCTVSPPDLHWPLDPTLIGTAVANLVSNALRYSPPDKPVALSAAVKNGGLVITVADGGPGLSDDELSHLGQPYYRAGTSAGKQGTGLGYHFSRKMVEAQGGALTASNQADGGLCVRLSWPAP